MAKLTKDFEPYKNLWMTAADWLRWHESWMNDSLSNIDPEQLAYVDNMTVIRTYIRIHTYIYLHINKFI